MKCKSCGSKLPSGSDFCPICGAWNPPIPMEMLSDEEHLNMESEWFAEACMQMMEENLPYINEVKFDNKMQELITPEDARWLALLIDTEGSLGWILFTWRGNRINKEYRYVYHYSEPYISIGMSERESKATIDEASRIMTTKAYTIKRPINMETRLERTVRVDGTKALTIMKQCLPHFVKFKRLAQLCLTLFKYRINPSRENFVKVIAELFGKYLTAEEANGILLDMTSAQFENFIKKAENLTNRYLRI